MSKARILAVDDQLYFRVFLEDLLRAEDYEVVSAADGPEALERVAEGAFDLVLTDLVMPGMDGAELVQRLKERRPDQDVVVLTSVGDVKTAVDAMKLGADDYLLKPIDREALLQAIDGILRDRRLREEHARLLAENLEYMGAFTLYERGLGLFSLLAPEALADRIAEVFCLETAAHGGVVWIAREDDPERLSLAGVRGLVRIEAETEDLSLGSLPPGLEGLRDPAGRSFLCVPAEESDGEAHPALYTPLRHAGRVVAVVRVTDRLDGGAFGDAERAIAERLAPFAGQAAANALRFRALERQSFRDSTTGAYTRAYFEDVTRNEIQKAGRFGRTFSLVRLVLDSPGALRTRLSQGGYSRWLEAVTCHVARTIRATDLLATESESQICLLLPETDAIGAAVLKRRVRAVLERCAEMRDLDPDDRPTVMAAAASFPSDGPDLAHLCAVLDQGVEEDRGSLVRALELDSAPFRGLVDALLAEAHPGRPETAEQVTRLLLGEVGRRPEVRGLLFVSPGAGLLGALKDGLESVRGTSPRTEIVLVAERRNDAMGGVPVTWVSPSRAGTPCPFVIYFGEGPPYALVRDELVEDGETSWFHTGDPVLVEQLAFQLGRDLGFPIGG